MMRDSVMASFLGILVQYEGTQQPPNLAMITTTKRIAWQIAKLLWKLMFDRFTFIILVVTKTGKSTPDTMQSNLLTRVDPNGGPSGTAKPKIKGPNTINWLNQLDSKPEHNTAKMMV